MRLITLTFSLLLSYSLIGQNIKVLDSETKQPIPGVLVELIDSQNNRADAQVTNIDGVAHFTKEGKFLVKASHVSYETYSIKLSSSSTIGNFSNGTTP